ncbi:hypothetical protein L596_007746 [Steinernema carpocapsae]|uniref:Endonuclease/exonuclease/phosphatase domain-containing protein n=1 Tax=Steinernema carpocapsae TaxID=34508 RepID=A0A4U5PAV9_STECR|nr:hypothetical protein L596_007746 [Steinernema carpocapsae]
MSGEASNIDYESALVEFVQITNTDEACAHFFLQDVDWDIQRAVTAYFETINAIGPEIERHRQEQHEQQSSETSGSKKREAEIVELSSDEAEYLEGAPKKKPKLVVVDPDSVEEIGLVTWNIDGIEQASIGTRVSAILCIIARLNPEVIMLQEAVPSALLVLQSKLGKMYNVIEGDSNFPYFTVVFISKNIRVERNSFRPFGNSGMGRGLQIVECSYKGLPLKIVNCHLESMREFSDQRKAQFKELMEALKTFKEQNPDCVVIGGGDLNIRDEEISEYPAGIKDAWIESGMVAKERWTWDTSKNDNKFRGSVRARFDRVYFAGPLNQVEFSLHGQKRIRNLGMFPSDHWAVNCRFFRS